MWEFGECIPCVWWNSSMKYGYMDGDGCSISTERAFWWVPGPFLSANRPKHDAPSDCKFSSWQFDWGFWENHQSNKNGSSATIKILPKISQQFVLRHLKLIDLLVQVFIFFLDLQKKLSSVHLKRDWISVWGCLIHQLYYWVKGL